MKRSTLILLLVAGGACASSREDCTIEDALLQLSPLPEDPGMVVERAEYVRSAGGVVVLAEKVGPATEARPQVSLTDDSGYYLARAAEVADFAIRDALGHTDLPDVIEVRAFSGVRYVATESGDPVCIEPDFPGLNMPQELNSPILPSDTQPIQVLMLLPDEGWYLHRRARPTDEALFLMEGGTDRASLDELRI